MQREAQKRDHQAKSKINTQLQDIQKVFQEKGYEHEAAFAKKERERRERPAKVVEEEPLAFSKKRRI